jgi:Predicted membrane protein (DUF2142)
MRTGALRSRWGARAIAAPGLSAFLLFFGLTGLWSVITPLYGAPDEPAHVIRAESLVRGEILGSTVKGTDFLQVSAPGFLASAQVKIACYAFKRVVPASCAHLDGGPASTRKMLTSAGRHPPTYYALIGLPSLLNASLPGVWLMRLLSALLCAGMFGLAVGTAWRYLRGTMVFAGLAIAATPMVFFLAGIVNPSGLEISAAAAVWVAGLAVVAQGEHIDDDLVVRLGVASGALILSRQLGLLWVAVIAGTLVVSRGLQPVLALWRSRRARWWLGGLTLVGVAQVAWVVAVGSLNTETMAMFRERLAVLDRLRISFGNTYSRFIEMLGLLGWRDTAAPAATYFLWTLALGGLVTALYLVGSRRVLVAIGLLTAAVIIIPPLFEVPSEPSLGFFWQGRYTLPIAIGIPILAGAVIRPAVSSRLRRRPTSLLSVALGLSLLLAFWAFWRRNAVGTSGKIIFFSDPSWRAPLPAWILVPAVVVFTAGWLWLVLLGCTPAGPEWTASRTDAETPGPSAERASVGTERPGSVNRPAPSAARGPAAPD